MRRFKGAGSPSPRRAPQGHPAWPTSSVGFPEIRPPRWIASLERASSGSDPLDGEGADEMTPFALTGGRPAPGHVPSSLTLPPVTAPPFHQLAVSEDPLLMGPWFLGESHVPSETSQVALPETSSLAPVALDDAVTEQVEEESAEESGVPMTFHWSQVAGAIGAAATGTMLMLAVYVSTIGGWSAALLPAYAQVPAAYGATQALVAHVSTGDPPSTPPASERIVPAAIGADTEVLGGDAVDVSISRALAVCPMKGIDRQAFQVHVVFEPSGHARSATVVGRGGETSGAAGCVRGIVLRETRVPPFSGNLVGVARTLWVQ